MPHQTQPHGCSRGIFHEVRATQNVLGIVFRSVGVFLVRGKNHTDGETDDEAQPPPREWIGDHSARVDVCEGQKSSALRPVMVVIALLKSACWAYAGPMLYSANTRADDAPYCKVNER